MTEPTDAARNGAADAYPFDGTDPDNQIVLRRAYMAGFADALASAKPAPSSGDVCLKCGETRGAIRREGLICWDGHDELGKHRFRPWPSSPTTPDLPTTQGETNV